MKFFPEKCKIEDQRMKSFIDPEELWDYINNTQATKERVREIIAKALNKERLTLAETAVLINASDPELIEEIKQGARTLKEKVYGNRIVLFAPLYIGNKCTNNCKYCGFRVSNKDAIRQTLDDQQIVKEVEALEDNGQKRLILVYGEHPDYSPEYIAHTVKTVYGVRKGNGEIRRVNINAAPLDIDGFRIVKESGIGTYQVFQETYHPEAYAKYHLGGKKKDFDWRLTSLDRAQEAGVDDVGIGALFGLYDWRYEVLALVRHTNHFEACYNVGPHTISFPRIQSASDIDVDPKYLVSDEDFVKLVAILRLAVPYTGMILTARESVQVRREVLQFGVSQIDGGTKLELGSYSDTKNEEQNLNREQFVINDNRSLAEIIDELIDTEYLPSFCTACYRLGRTGEHFMEFSVPGFIKRYCTPNAILTLAEYLVDYASEDTAKKAWIVINKNIENMEDEKIRNSIKEKVEKIKSGTRDLYY
ncbi:MAG: [FeFe] hydrogenase H-cluster radical SAM maturase HydG [Bacteroidetes bacterium GWC2_33_15]|nr:MAG: [FeFe] hydrogenase H-cluster radical SAM maturase HydG [Bacteroidetes bacterium GWA2_33_15]OFX50285.1 MAG: [FeFe] hydrogenase H-cluster radical SAM maturase HydG [Bacteroidetes bacterium GWC2_33_15]OFX66797.1 MAG: [FeFe] hydrogenase H-cluster radical SAM maturase HydG [Bacteroidetes bacterium GWB2_32_14]OFX69416.1 MAG: [FeFe] hydrogenase H-cluster radical SAM maturase HydG [Bacteroidetes bacterium GWD2_33_33]HAN18740.1 [FeFe] hydrogenase H-cluster radical SAM maturase HydG [Bacteroidale